MPLILKLALFTTILLPALLVAQPRAKFPVLYNKEDINVAVTVSNASGINTDGYEFSPSIYEGGLVYVSQYKSGRVDEKTGKTFFELFYADLDPNGEPIKGNNFSVELNSQLHEGPVSFNRRGDKIFFTRSNLKNGVTHADSKGRVGLKIYMAHRGYYDWENIEELPFNSDEYSCMHPSLSADEHKLFFSSNMPGGYGGLDLYFVEYKNGKWSRPINLGPDVNSSGNDVFPFIHESGTLFFSSDGRKGFGNIDMFMIDLSGRKWGKALNLGAPFNTEQDDFGLMYNEGATLGYFSSNREGGRGEDDIYIVKTPKGIRSVEPAAQVGTLIAVYDKATGKSISNVNVRVYEKKSEGLIKADEFFDVGIDESVEDTMSLKLVKKPDDVLGDPKWVTNAQGEVMVPLEANKEFLIHLSKSGFTTKQIDYSTLYDKREELEIALEKSNCLNLVGKVMILGYATPIPNASVIIYNHCDSTKSYASTTVRGVFETCLPMGCKYDVTLIKSGFEQAKTQVSTMSVRGSRSMHIDVPMHPQATLSLNEPISKGSVIILDNIYYDFNKSAIRKGAAPDLEALAQLMNNFPSMEIELGAHTDTRGDESYNLKLSERRAESAKQFLVNKGVEANRITTKGFGEAYPRNRCLEGVECTEEEHAVNRRAEVRIKSINETAVPLVNKNAGDASNGE